MSDDYPIYCPAQTYRATRETPAEFCETEVADYGDLCPAHAEDDRADELYDAYLDAKYERENYPETFYDHGDQPCLYSSFLGAAAQLTAPNRP